MRRRANRRNRGTRGGILTWLNTWRDSLFATRPIWAGSTATPESLILKEVKKRALIVEDEPHVRLLMERVLARAGWEVIAVEDVAAGLEWIDSVDVMVVDYYLATERGPELVRKAREELGVFTPPALLITGTPDEVPVADWDLFVGSLSKPFKVDALVDAVDQIVAPRKRARSGTRRKSSLFAAPTKKDEAV